MEWTVMSAGRRMVRTAGILTLLGAMALTTSSPPAHAADGTALFIQSAKNLAHLGTFVERFSLVEANSTARLQNQIIKAFDRRNSRVEGQQTVIESRKSTNGSWHTAKYVAAVIMLNNHTYVRTSRSAHGWTVHSGYGYTDPVTKGRWLPAFPDYSQYPGKFGLTFSIASRSKGMIHLVGHGMRTPEHVSVDITTGRTPILTRITTTGGTANTGTFVQITAESSFNKTLNITAPKVGR